jgi:hypothetical protein
MAPRSKAHKQRLNALARVENPGRKKAQPHPDSSGQLPIIGPRGGTSKWTAIRIQARVRQQVQDASVASQHLPSLASHQRSPSRTPSQQPSAGPHPDAKTDDWKTPAPVWNENSAPNVTYRAAGRIKTGTGRFLSYSTNVC